MSTFLLVAPYALVTRTFTAPLPAGVIAGADGHPYTLGGGGSVGDAANLANDSSCHCPFTQA